MEMSERLIEAAALDALAIAHKSGNVAIGFAKTDAAITHGAVAGVLHAVEAAPDGVRKLQASLRGRFSPDTGKIPVIGSLNSAQLDLALGRSNVIHAALLAGPESETFLARAARLDRFRAPVANHAKASEDRN
jgi:ribosomal protein L7Ae-like RNA K-turn-binding protein